jgi:hypothetical protein
VVKETKKGYVVLMVKIRNVYNILIRKSLRKKLVGSLRLGEKIEEWILR